MASVRITLSTGDGDYEVDLSRPETNGQAWGRDKSYLDNLVDEAVIRLKRAYTPTPAERLVAAVTERGDEYVRERNPQSSDIPWF